MKTKSIVFLFVMVWFASVLVRAQDTIDSAYYRYGNNFLEGEVKPLVYDEQTGTYVIDEETGEYISACPNGYGFSYLDPALDPSEYIYRDEYDVLTYYMYYKIGVPSTKIPIYGIAISLDSVTNFMEGDSLTVILCEPSPDRSHFIHIDSIVIRGADIGKQRWCEIPIAKEPNSATGLWTYQEENCIDTVMYRSMMEFYFEEPREVGSNGIFWRVKVAGEYGSRFHSTYVVYDNDFICYYSADCSGLYGIVGWDLYFPILTPLPEWEVPSMRPLTPEREYNPALHQDPQDPEDPEDPENPGGDEGIGEAVGSQQSAVNIYPNPASGYAVVTCDAPILELTLCDVNGRVLLTLRNCGGSAKVDTSGLVPGVYMLRVTTNTGTVTRKLAVK